MLIKMVKKDNVTKMQSTKIRLIAVLLALVTAGLFILALGHNPIDVYISLIKGSLGTGHRVKQTIIKATPIIITSLGIMVAFKMKFWNIGGEGQILMGAFLASFVALNFKTLPQPVLLLLMFIAGIIGGGLWSTIPALLKVKFDTNETIITLMLNYIAIKWVTYLQYGPWKDPEMPGYPRIPNFVDNAVLPKVLGIHIGWIIAIILVVIIYIFLNYSKKGYEINVVGESQDTARYAGMNVKKIVVSSIFLSGAICGIVGVIEASAVNQTLSAGVSNGYGFTAIITAWLSGLNAIIIVPVSLLFAMLIQGGSFIQSAFQIPQAAADVLQGIILFFVLGSEFFVRYRIVIGNKQVKEVA